MHDSYEAIVLGTGLTVRTTYLQRIFNEFYERNSFKMLVARKCCTLTGTIGWLGYHRGNGGRP